MIRFLFAFTWLRWRLMIAGLRSRGRRGAGAIIAAWAEVLAGLFVAALLLAGGLSLALLATQAGDALIAGGEPRHVTLLTMRALLGLATAGLALLPLLMAFRGASQGRERLLLLPIPRGQLHAVEIAGALLDPWLGALVPATVTVAVVLALGGHGAAAATAALAGALTLLALASLASLVAFLTELVLRDRRRAEIFMFVLMVGIIALSIVPTFIENAQRGRRGRERAAAAAPATPPAPEAAEESETPATTRADGATADPAQRGNSLAFAETFPWWMQALPSEAYARAVAEATRGRPLGALPSLALLGLVTTGLFVLSGTAWRRLVSSPASASRRRSLQEASLGRWKLPLLGTATSAVAIAMVRTAWRTVPGKLALVMPPIVVALFGLGPLRDGLATFPASFAAIGGATVALMSLQTFTLNQFAMDGPGLSLEMLSPLAARTLVRGKAVGGAILAAVPVVLATVTAFLLWRERSPLAGLEALLAAASAYFLVTPVAAAMSALLPKAVDLGKLGRHSQPHQLAGIVGMLFTLVAFAIPSGLLLLGQTLVGPWGGLAFVGGWFLVTLFVSQLLLTWVAGLFWERREGVLLAIAER